MSNKKVVSIIIALIVTTLVGFYMGSNSKFTNLSQKKFLVQCYTPNDQIVINTIVRQVRFTKIWILTLEDDKEIYFNGPCKVSKF